MIIPVKTETNYYFTVSTIFDSIYKIEAWPIYDTESEIHRIYPNSINFIRFQGSTQIYLETFFKGNYFLHIYGQLQNIKLDGEVVESKVLLKNENPFIPVRTLDLTDDEASDLQISFMRNGEATLLNDMRKKYTIEFDEIFTDQIFEFDFNTRLEKINVIITATQGSVEAKLAKESFVHNVDSVTKTVISSKDIEKFIVPGYSSVQLDIKVKSLSSKSSITIEFEEVTYDTYLESDSVEQILTSTHKNLFYKVDKVDMLLEIETHERIETSLHFELENISEHIIKHGKLSFVIIDRNFFAQFQGKVIKVLFKRTDSSEDDLDFTARLLQGSKDLIGQHDCRRGEFLVGKLKADTLVTSESELTIKTRRMSVPSQKYHQIVYINKEELIEIDHDTFCLVECSEDAIVTFEEKQQMQDFTYVTRVTFRNKYVVSSNDYHIVRKISGNPRLLDRELTKYTMLQGSFMLSCNKLCVVEIGRVNDIQPSEMMPHFVAPQEVIVGVKYGLTGNSELSKVEWKKELDLKAIFVTFPYENKPLIATRTMTISPNSSIYFETVVTAFLIDSKSKYSIYSVENEEIVSITPVSVQFFTFFVFVPNTTYFFNSKTPVTALFEENISTQIVVIDDFFPNFTQSFPYEITILSSKSLVISFDAPTTISVKDKVWRTEKVETDFRVKLHNLVSIPESVTFFASILAETNENAVRASTVENNFKVKATEGNGVVSFYAKKKKEAVKLIGVLNRYTLLWREDLKTTLLEKELKLEEDQDVVVLFENFENLDLRIVELVVETIDEEAYWSWATIFVLLVFLAAACYFFKKRYDINQSKLNYKIQYMKKSSASHPFIETEMSER